MNHLYRHEPTCGLYCDGPRMEYRADGDWVRFEDYSEVEKQRDALRAEVERLREAARQVHALALTGDDPTHGWIDRTLREIHTITKGLVE